VRFYTPESPGANVVNGGGFPIHMHGTQWHSKLFQYTSTRKLIDLKTNYDVISLILSPPQKSKQKRDLKAKTG